ncbi:M1 family metallopeptidase [Lentiprolixibacter aurantiacus]|uniref:M1 family metallopeptidase n=1 Tax=Lentiprolixibacter aurantiacus TaxID=2993939 RepID=A0AAE3MMN7_9FLAO|nr:M1 family metallopeptidase [Lentiprolixibacter aurantiacus]MCX2720258.1 M1 family metallopeptidase [Lentiprolixibacter aurantiacus]
MIIRKLAGLLAILSISGVTAQDKVFTEQDTLRGSITPERAWWDLTYYHLDISIDPDRKYITGSNTIQYKVLESNNRLQVDLQPPLKIDKVIQDGKQLKWESRGNAHFLVLEGPQPENTVKELKVYYSGKPVEAEMPPWDGGFTWTRDANEKHFVATSCQGIGASIWWPNKDHMYDEADSMAISVTVPKDLTGVANGRLRSVEKGKKSNTYHWFVSNPINNYGVNVNIGDYVHFGEVFKGENGPLNMDYYVLRDNLEKAKTQFTQAPMTIEAFEYWFGPYPFYEDSYKLVEVPYLGMEHQSSVTYGNGYQNGYLGRDLSGSGGGQLFDFIIVHETGHEWFANNITYKDAADMWIHEGFTAYSENLYLEYWFGIKHYEEYGKGKALGKRLGADYVLGTRKLIRNDRPIIGQYNVNNPGSGDMYYKGSNMLHTLRQLVEDDELWRKVLRGLNKEFYHQTVTTKQIENYISEKTGKDLSAFFNQYLRTTKIPVLEFKLDGELFSYRYSNIVDGFDMPLRIYIEGRETWIFPSANWKTDKIESNAIPEFDPNFYVETRKYAKSR